MFYLLTYLLIPYSRLVYGFYAKFCTRKLAKFCGSDQLTESQFPHNSLSYFYRITFVFTSNNYYCWATHWLLHHHHHHHILFSITT